MAGTFSTLNLLLKNNEEQNLFKQTFGSSFETKILFPHFWLETDGLTQYKINYYFRKYVWPLNYSLDCSHLKSYNNHLIQHNNNQPLTNLS